MGSQRDGSAKKPARRGLQRRLFSVESTRDVFSDGSVSDSSYVNDEEQTRERSRSQATTLRLVDRDTDQPTTRSPPPRSWTNQNISESPQDIHHEDDFFLTHQPYSPNDVVVSNPLKVRGTIPVPIVTAPPPPSKVRWEHLRMHVLPSPAPSTPTSSVTTSSKPATSTQARTQASKPSRLQRLGFRGVVEHAREVAVDESRRFADDVRKACWAARFAETTRTAKPDREATLATMGSALYLPFMSNSSLPVSANASTAALTSTNVSRKFDLRRPQSTQSLSMIGRTTPSLKYLYQTLMHHASPSVTATRISRSLPHENQVLSTLLVPLLITEVSPRTDEEQWFAIETFEVAIKTWRASSNESGLERCLWCCRAALTSSSPFRARILSILDALMFSIERQLQADSPTTLKTISQGLFSLLRALSRRREIIPEINVLRELVSQVRTGAGGTLDVESVEQEYNAIYTGDDTDIVIREAIIGEAFASCLENGDEPDRQWVLRNLSEENWPLARTESFTPLLSSIQSRKLRTFSHAIRGLFASLESADCNIVTRLLHTRVIPEAEALRGSAAIETRSEVVRVVLELLCVKNAKHVSDWLSDLLRQWYSDTDGWKSNVEKSLKEIVTESDWPTCLRILTSLIDTTTLDDFRKPLVSFALPLLHDQLIASPPQYPCLPLTTLLETISQLYPQIFYKPLFACAASSKDLTVAGHLCTLIAVSKFVPDFWCRDAEMMSVALMSNAGAKGNSATTKGNDLTWGTARLGQSVLLIELSAHIQSVRKAMELSLHQERSYVVTMKFVTILEARLGILIENKERVSLIPPSQRLIFCVLFLEIRLLTRSLKPSTWLSRVVSWFLESTAPPENGNDTNENENEAPRELRDSTNKLRALYISVREGSTYTQKRRSTMLFSPISQTIPPTNSSADRNPDDFATFEERSLMISMLPEMFDRKFLELFVALSGMLNVNDYHKLDTILWNRYLDNLDPQVVASTCFLIMQCAEKTHSFLSIIRDDLHSHISTIRLRAIQRISVIVNWRLQILSQQVIVDRSHRRPFKLTRGPLPFVATDIGSSLFVLEEDPDDAKDNLPLELRERLSEVGWAQEEKTLDQKAQWMRTPMTLLPNYQLDRLDGGQDQTPPSPLMSPAPSPERSRSPGESEQAEVIRRKSSTVGGGPGVKRRAVFVPSLVAILPELAMLLFDPNFLVASAARHTITDLMRNDPALLVRPIFDLFAESQDNINSATSVLQALLHARRVLPPAIAHSVFNHLTGFLKFAARQSEEEEDEDETLRGFAHAIPIISKLVTQVSGMSIREFRRAKIETFLIPSGSLWFRDSAPPGPMFPRSLRQVHNQSTTVPPQLAWMTMIRLSQNMLFLAMLKRSPQDVQLIRKNMARLVLPSNRDTNDALPLELKDFVPRRTHSQMSLPSYTPLGSLDTGARGLSSMISRSYLILLAQLFRSMSRHLNDRNELSILLDGLNRILLAHGDDIGVVSQALIALMVASTRFRRLFTSGGGYTLFMPTVLKVYAESERHLGIRLAIEYAVSRFFALHEESFVFQSLNSMGPLFMTPDIDGDWLAKCIFALFSPLWKGISPSTPDPAGIHNANKLQEREALLVGAAEEKPQSFLASVTRGGNRNGEQVMIDLPEEYEARRLSIDDFVRMLLTIIAHDPTLLRAEQFLRLLRYLTPYLPISQSIPQQGNRSVLRDGIDALGVIVLKTSSNKAKEGVQSRTVGDLPNGLEYQSTLESHLLSSFKAAADVSSMRLDYLAMIVAFTTAGGKLGLLAQSRVMDLIKMMLKDATRDNHKVLASFFRDYTRTSLLRDIAPTLKEVLIFLRQIAPVVNAYIMLVDFSGVFDTVSQLAVNPIYAKDPTFSQLVVTELCGASLEACEAATSTSLFLNLPCRKSLVSLLIQAISLRGSDVIAEIERRVPSYNFLVGIIFPLVMVLKTTRELVSRGVLTDAWCRDAHSRSWVRILSYAMSASRLQDRAYISNPERSKSRQSDPSGKSRMKILVASIQIVKIIIVRAEVDISTCLPDIWPRVASFLKAVLENGNALFAFKSQSLSSAPTPSQSPRHSLDKAVPSSIGFDLPELRSSATNPRIVDYSLWSFFELLCLCRSPLLLQMRLFMRERVASLDQEIRSQNEGLAGLGRRSRRVSSTIFSKPRRRTSGYESGIPSLESSPVLSASQSVPIATDGLSLRQPGYARFPSADGPQDGPGRRIVHLGPVQHSPHDSVSSQLSMDNNDDRMANSAKVKSLKLVVASYRRIRLVQMCMGYDTLLPMPNIDVGRLRNGIDDDDPVMRAWSKKQASEAIARETENLIEEFDDVFKDVEDDMVLVDPDQSATF